jgi:hypothetical protein
MKKALVRMSLAACIVSSAVGGFSTNAWARPAHCSRATGVCTPPSKLRWHSPRSISDGVPATFRSVTPCPNQRPDGSPIQGARAVEIDVTFSSGGGMGDVAPVRADGSWTFVHTFEANGFQDRDATVQAKCLDVTNTGFDIADYRSHAISVNTRHRRHD